MPLTEVADGVHRLEHAYVNVYLVEHEGRLLVVDTGLPGTWRELGDALRRLGRRPADVAAVVLTHAHFDHTGSAAAFQERLGVPVWLHPEDFTIAAHPYRYAHENVRAVYPLRYPRSLRVLGSMTAAGALRVRGVEGLRPLAPGDTLPVPGNPRVVFTPGHTFGHCALHLPHHDVLICGDALVTLDPYTGRRGPQIVAGAATADSAQALVSLDRLVAYDSGSTLLLPGHGDPWSGGVADAVERARAVGAH
ncbi:MBL fold metallo-hydrolase [Promicromonospora thailandica]|uniref:Glyoxylase, beta-lactamase superfamily II n=1 Tax=Promicromonospora thailandica TaxID=765201 RepID=A0A9X2JXA6_9MICO|nr:MBL fold metallo-hydrolase [Promicromonospora thailandica]MCP2267046.1 Glyoxylase, beta-lactamase superfamily II [Promicromonospora thailandica]BFF16674.1 MBL fold metallo-hydrolase [Promicromonospora thailandica]